MPRPGTLEQSRQSGSEVRIRRTDEGGARWLNLGAMTDPPTHNIQADRTSSFDSRGRAAVVEDIIVGTVEESYTFRVKNQSPDMLSLFYGAELPSNFAQASTAVVGQNHTANLGAEISLTDAAGVRVFAVSNVVVKDQAGTTTYVLGADYLLDAVKGVVTPLTTGAIIEGETLQIDFTPGEITASPLVLPQTMAKGVEVEAEIWEIPADGSAELVRTIPRGLIFSSGNRQLGHGQDNWIELELRVMSDPISSQPAGAVKRTG